jgi:hypothetical protein
MNRIALTSRDNLALARPGDIEQALEFDSPDDEPFPTTLGDWVVGAIGGCVCFALGFATAVFWMLSLPT